MRKWISALLVLALFTGLLAPAQAGQVKLIALTFDDGPNREITSKVLDLFAQENVKATFFLVGEWLPGRDDLVMRYLDEGHQIGTHTFGHAKLTTLKDDQIKAQIACGVAPLQALTGQTKYMLRPPYGDCDKRVLSLAGMPVIHWSIDPAEGKQIPGDKMAKSIISQAKDGAIILMHDTTQDNYDALHTVISTLHNQGYEFVTVNELFRLKGVTPQNGVMYRTVTNSNPQNYDESALDQHWAASSINYMTSKAYMLGDNQGWRPNRYLNRAMAVTVLWRMQGSPAVTIQSGTGFVDVAKDAWYASPVVWAKQQGFIHGKTADTFAPMDSMTREQLYVMVGRLAMVQNKLPSAAANMTVYGDDARIGPWALEFVQDIRRLGFQSINDVELFRPRDAVTRAEAAELFCWYHLL